MKTKVMGLVLVAIFGLASCSSTPDGPALAVSEAENIVAENIVVLSGDASVLVEELVSAERIVATTDRGAGTPAVETVLPAGGTVDPEQILSLDPDLVLLTSRHESEDDTADILNQAGVQVASFESSNWSDIDSLLDTFTDIAQLVGEEDKADRLVEEIKAQRAEVDTAVDKTRQPRVLSLMARGGQRFFVPTSAMLNGLVEEAGGYSVNGELGAVGTVAADPEQILALQPDVILVEDFRGQGRADFADLLTNPALAEVPAITNANVAYLPQSEIGSAAGLKIVDGLKLVAASIGTFS
ncbi:ABC transporter substrate-binding protein [Corynebacterium suranareeae]|uniref:ABC transporter substrate-binding protein n=1 Tax=Corynebacterium suranareeae TaxID=2506452 RepID=A0A160PMT3_9CORY|nr:ABC transporter substrate-binding protein [Corynebacterium suranareeae]BAU95089.1 ABC transporter substrate-binding protein [Corynebacterium suranareeae]